MGPLDVSGLARSSNGKQVSNAPPRLLFVLNDAPFFITHRLPLALAARDARRAADAMHHHIAKRSEQATEAVRVAYSQIYVPN